MYTAFIDLYCERTAPGLWNEPINAVSNLVFVIAALYAWKLTQQRGASDLLERLVIILAASIGLGSFLFHTFATTWAEVADIVPIWTFVATFVLVTTYRLSAHHIGKTIRIFLMVALIAIGIHLVTGTNTITEPKSTPLMFNGSIQYAPALFALGLFTVISYRKQHAFFKYLAFALLCFLAALVFRSIDLTACQTTQGIGTHFLWHLLNGLVIATLLNGLVSTLPPKIPTVS